MGLLGRRGFARRDQGEIVFGRFFTRRAEDAAHHPGPAAAPMKFRRLMRPVLSISML